MIRLGIAVILLNLLFAFNARADHPSDEIQRRLDAGEPLAAWAVAEPMLLEHAGDPQFDFVAGLAALEAGQPQHALMAFERVLLLQPANHRARLELARAYFLLNDHAAARREFQAVQTAGPPPNVRRRVDNFLAEIRRRESAQRLQLNGYAELRAGWDSNVASATADSSIEIPAIGVVTLSDNEASDRFLDKNAGLTLVRPLDKRRALFLDLAYRDRENVTTQAYDIRSVGLSTGLAWAVEQNLLRLPVQYQVLYLANRKFRELAAVGAEWSRELDASNQLLAFGQIGRIRYPDDAVRDVDLFLLGGGWSHRYDGLPLLLSASAYLGDEAARASGGDANGRFYFGTRLGAQWSGIPRHTPYVGLTWQRSVYDAANPVFRRTRNEDFAELRLGWSWQPRPLWTFTAEANVVNNAANIGLYEYRRRQFSLGARYQFE